MPVRIPNDLPARKILAEENIFVMTDERAVHQDIRPLRIAVLNLMPTKIVTETQILRLLGNSPLQIDIIFIRMIVAIMRSACGARRNPALRRCEWGMGTGSVRSCMACGSSQLE